MPLRQHPAVGAPRRHDARGPLLPLIIANAASRAPKRRHPRPSPSRGPSGEWHSCSSKQRARAIQSVTQRHPHLCCGVWRRLVSAIDGGQRAQSGSLATGAAWHHLIGACAEVWRPSMCTASKLPTLAGGRASRATRRPAAPAAEPACASVRATTERGGLDCSHLPGEHRLLADPRPHADRVCAREAPTGLVRAPAGHVGRGAPPPRRRGHPCALAVQRAPAAGVHGSCPCRAVHRAPRRSPIRRHGMRPAAPPPGGPAPSSFTPGIAGHARMRGGKDGQRAGDCDHSSEGRTWLCPGAERGVWPRCGASQCCSV